MTNDFKKSSDTFKAIDKYLNTSLGFKLIKLAYAGTHSNEGLTPIIHYDCEAKLDEATTKFRATVYWNNDVPVDATPTITRMDVM